jgi:hypothetical protein
MEIVLMSFIKDFTTTSTTTADEKQTRNGQDHARVFDPENRKLLVEILNELKKMNIQLSIITEEEEL